MRLAIYGKGGIGKSTIAANLSAAWANRRRKVLHIGCDPKSDSTRLLLGKRANTTVLDYLRSSAPDGRSLSDIVIKGYGGIDCVEAGGPEPGVGCAGRGILSTFTCLEDLGLDRSRYDAVVYDVLGDVVCGGFAVPLRNDVADLILIVTSGEFMSIYAANNILRGVANYDQKRARLAGLVLNCRGLKNEEESVIRFSKAVELPIIATIPRSDLFRKAEAAYQTLGQFSRSSETACLFDHLAEMLFHTQKRYRAVPLDDHELEVRVLAKKIARKPATEKKFAPPARLVEIQKPPEAGTALTTPEPSEVPEKAYISKSLLFQEPLHGCAFAGALNITTQIKDAVTIVHGPTNCVHIASNAIVSSGLRTLRQHRIPIEEQLHPRIQLSKIDDNAVIFGAGELLEEQINRALNSSAKIVFIVGTCPSAIIGEDLDRSIHMATNGSPPKPVLPIAADGNLAGDYMQGLINASIQGAAELIDPEVSTRDNLVNIVAEKNIAANTEANFIIISKLLHSIGIEVNCRFVRHVSSEAIRNFKRAPLNLLASGDHFGRLLTRFLADRFHSVFAKTPFPVGRWESEQWIREIAAFFNKSESAENLILQQKLRYDHKIEPLKGQLSGKRLMVISYNHNIDWLLETAFDVGMEVVRVGILNYTQDSVVKTRFANAIDFQTNYTPDQRSVDIENYKPDLVLSNYAATGMPATSRYDTLPLCPDIGFESGLAIANRWVRVLQGPQVEGWQHDRRLFS